MKNEFVSTVSHELRTPLTSIQASLAMLADGMAGELPPDAARLTAIAPEFQQRVFQRFAQADAADSRTRGGTGLGLAISRAIIEEHGGTIGFSTAAERGTRFTVMLPAAAAPASAGLLPQS